MARTRHAQHYSGTERRILLKRLAILFIAGAEDEEDELFGVTLLVVARRYRFCTGPRGSYNAAKSDDFLYKLLHKFTGKWFKSHLRMSRESFWHVHDLIKDDPAFVSTGRRPQRPVAVQLSTFLMRSGGQSAIHAASHASIAEGTAYLYSARIRKALQNIRDLHLAWPGPRRRAYLKDVMETYGFPGCIGIVDASLIPLADKPKKDGWAYFCRKKFYAFVVQAICDHRGIFTEYDMGWPGSVQDTKVFRESAVFLRRSEHFAPDEYILADKGYPLTKFTIRPFADCDLTADPGEARARRQWNYELSHLRIAVEHAFGRLKGRFPALRNLTGQDLESMLRTIEACMILHNILTELGDDPTTIEGYNGAEYVDGMGENNVHENMVVQAAEDQEEIDEMDEEMLYRTGLYRRKELLRLAYM